MKKNLQNIIQEVKPAKRIGWITLYDHAKLKTVARYKKARELGIRSYHDLFNVEKFKPQERFSILESLFPGIIQGQEIFENITPTVGFEVITKAQTGNLGSLDEISVNVHALGSGSTAPAAGDTELETEVARKLISTRSYSGNKAYYTIVYGLTEGNGTHTEMGLFMNADDGVPDDGTLWDRSLVNIIKTGAQSLTIDYEDTFTNA